VQRRPVGDLTADRRPTSPPRRHPRRSSARVVSSRPTRNRGRPQDPPSSGLLERGRLASGEHSLRAVASAPGPDSAAGVVTTARASSSGATPLSPQGVGQCAWADDAGAASTSSARPAADSGATSRWWWCLEGSPRRLQHHHLRHPCTVDSAAVTRRALALVEGPTKSTRTGRSHAVDQRPYRCCRQRQRRERCVTPLQRWSYVARVVTTACDVYRWSAVRTSRSPGGPAGALAPARSSRGTPAPRRPSTAVATTTPPATARAREPRRTPADRGRRGLRRAGRSERGQRCAWSSSLIALLSSLVQLARRRRHSSRRRALLVGLVTSPSRCEHSRVAASDRSSAKRDHHRRVAGAAPQQCACSAPAVVPAAVCSPVTSAASGSAPRARPACRHQLVERVDEHSAHVASLGRRAPDPPTPATTGQGGLTQVLGQRHRRQQ
jgi:hypothetical protein